MWKKIKYIFTREFTEDTFRNSGNRGEGGEGKRGLSYRRHFEGFINVDETDAKGKRRTVRVYNGMLYTPELIKKQRVGLKCLYSLMWLTSAAGFAFSATRAIAVNAMWYGAISQTILVICLFWSLIGLVNYLIAPLHRTVGEWRASTGSIKKSTLASCIAFGIAIGVDLLDLLVGTEFLVTQLMCIAWYLLGLLLMFSWNYIERNVKYTQTKQDADGVGGGA